MAKKENVIVGAASLLVGPAGEAAYTTPPTDAADWRDPALATSLGTGWRDVGYTQEGVEVSYEPDYGDVEVDQLLDSARIFKQSMRVTVGTTLAEATLENLLVVWGRPTTDLTGTAGAQTLAIEGGALGEAPVERGLVVVGNSAEGDGTNGTAGQYGVRVYRVFRAISVETTTQALRRNEPTVFAVSFRCLPNNAGRYGTVVDVPTPDPTP